MPREYRLEDKTDRVVLQKLSNLIYVRLLSESIPKEFNVLKIGTCLTRLENRLLMRRKWALLLWRGERVCRHAYALAEHHEACALEAARTQCPRATGEL